MVVAHIIYCYLNQMSVQGVRLDSKTLVQSWLTQSTLQGIT